MFRVNVGLNRGSYMSEFIKRVGEKDKMRGLPSILSLFRNDLINTIIQ